MNTPLLESLSHWLLRTSFEASVLILAVFALRAVFGQRLGPGWRIGLWMIVGLKLLLPACIPMGFGLGHWWANLAPAVSISAPEITVPAVALEMAVPEPSADPAVSETAAPAAAFSYSYLLLGAWLPGVVVVIAFAMIRQFRFLRRLSRCPIATNPHLLDTVSRLARMAGLRQPVRTVLMPPGSTPAVVGWRRARLLLPEDWSARFDDSSLRHVLLHELLHVRHRDLLWNWAALIVQAVHWFNPLVWLVVARFQSDRELRCDAGALALLSPNERLAYGHTLLRIQQTFFAPPAIAGLAPCVRNHPTLRQRILMIAEPTRLRPWLQAVFALAFVLLSGYAFTTSAEDEKPLPPKERPRETTRGNNTEPSREATETPRRREGDGAKSGMRDGERSKNAEREGDGARPRSREGDGTKTGARDGERPRNGERDGEQPKTGARDGERPRNSERDGQRPKTGERDGERPRTGNAERDKPGSQTNPNRREAGPASSETLTIRVSNDGSSVLVDGQELPMNRLRGFLHSYLPDHPGASVVVTGEPDTPYKALTGTMDAVRDNGNKKVSIAAP